MLTLVSLEQELGYASPLKTDRYHIIITINNQVATTKIKQIFTNPNDFEVNGKYIFPLPEDVALSTFALSIDGEPYSGKLLSHQESHRMYRRSAREGYNLGILDHLNTQAYVADVERIPAHSSRQIEFEYSQILPVEDDLVKFSHPLSLAKSANGAIADLAINIEIESEHEIRTINSASHELEIDRKSDNQVRLSYKGSNIEPDDDFQCYYSLSNDDIGITLLTHRADETEDGFFMLLVSPKFEVKKTDVIEKDFIFVLDHSGSMMGHKIEQAKEALSFCVNNLNDGDRFNLILFNTEITSFADRLKRQEGLFDGERTHHSDTLSDHLIDIREGRESAIAYIEGIEAGGGTNINDALLTALAEKPDPNRPRVIVFLTDGCPTAGVTNENLILRNVAQANNTQSRIFVFGVGYDLNMRLLDKLATENGGTRNYVEPNEDIEEAVSSLFRKMNEPVLVDVKLDFGQINTKEHTPMNLPDMFRDEQLMLLGRYEGYGDTVIKLRGAIGSEQQEFSKDVKFAEVEMDFDHLAQLWAQQRIAELVDQAAMTGSPEELQREIERLSIEFDVMTPYTSFEHARDGSLRRQLMSEIDMAYDTRKLRRDAVRDIKGIEFQKSHRHKIQHYDIKTIGRKTFHLHGRLWVDSKYDGQSETRKIEFGSDAYFDLVSKSNELAKCLKLSQSMIICHDGVNYEITPRRSEHIR